MRCLDCLSQFRLKGNWIPRYLKIFTWSILWLLRIQRVLILHGVFLKTQTLNTRILFLYWGISVSAVVDHPTTSWQWPMVWKHGEEGNKEQRQWHKWTVGGEFVLSESLSGCTLGLYGEKVCVCRGGTLIKANNTAGLKINEYELAYAVQKSPLN